MGDGDAGPHWLGTAIDRGFTDTAMIDTDEDLAPLRALPGWSALRARLGDPEPPH